MNEPLTKREQRILARLARKMQQKTGMSSLSVTVLDGKDKICCFFATGVVAKHCHEVMKDVVTSCETEPITSTTERTFFK